MNCEGCPYAGRGYVPGENLEAPRIVVGSSPGFEEVLNGKPFSGEDGRIVRRLLETVNTGYTYAVGCYADDNKANFEKARKLCEGRVQAEIRQREVLALGGDSAVSVTGHRIAVSKFRGTKVEGATVTFSPRYVLLQGGLNSTVGKQFCNDVKLWANPKPEDKKATILLNPGSIPKHVGAVVVDIETTGLDPKNGVIRCYGFAYRTHSGDVIAVVFSEYNRMVKKLLEAGKLVAQNYAFEQAWLKLPVPERWEDTMLQAHALYEDRGPGAYKLDMLVKDYLGPGWPEKGALLLGKHVLEAPIDTLMPYCGWDCLKELALYERFRDELLGTDGKCEDKRRLTERSGLRRSVKETSYDNSGSNSRAPTGEERYRRVTLPAALFLDGVERRGLAYSTRNCAREKNRFERRVLRIERALDSVKPNVNWNSDVQVKAICKELGLIPSGLKTDGGKAALHKLARKGLIAKNPARRGMLLLYDRYSKETHTLSRLNGITKYVDKDGRYHPRILLAGPKTGRLSVINPAVQTFERSLMKTVVPDKGYTLLEADYSGAEVLWMAFESQDEKLLDIVKAGRSLHSEVSKELGVPRKVAKVLNFAMGYGGGAPAVKRALDEVKWGKWSEEECRLMVSRRRNMFPRYSAWCRKQEAKAMRDGFVVSRFGGVRRLPGAKSCGSIQGEAFRQACNAPIQGAASDMALVRAMEISNKYSWAMTLALKHDSILWQVKDPVKAVPLLRKVLENPVFWWGTLNPAPRVEFKIGKDWGSLNAMVP